MRVMLRLFATCLVLLAMWCVGMGDHGVGAARAGMAASHAMAMQAARTAATRDGGDHARADHAPTSHASADHAPADPAAADHAAAGHPGAPCATMSGHCLDGVAGPQSPAARVASVALRQVPPVASAFEGRSPEAQDPPPRA